ncbi:hypothetical protein [Iningainema tapete]|uniref:Uncharacterized protein n=1 Tax=Iningainema tapete BLCC-T55 TaxID=2748662 RepID=A0A8J7C9C8_9CYAN|nr:hypothetical protein [Iningainema tapete]MBD2770880.1 hypothetical protein [Iningainema tapete BLCC-T55]
MNLPPQLQKEVEKWANRQGVSSKQFILQSVAEKVSILNQQIEELSPEQPKVYYEGSVLVVDAEPIGDIDINAFIHELREERIRAQT